MTWTLGYRALQALAVLVVAGLAGVGVTAYDNSRYDNVRLALLSQSENQNLTHCWLGGCVGHLSPKSKSHL